MKLKKLSEEHYIIMDDSEIKEGDLYLCWESKSGISTDYTIDNTFSHWIVGADNYKKITHSTQPLDCACSNRGYKLNTNCAERNRCFDKVQYLPLQEVKELLGVVDKAFERYPVIENDKDHNDRNYYRRSAYYQALEDNKEKKYTEDDLKKAICIAKDSMGVDNDGETCYSHLSTEQIIQSLQPQTEWEVEIVDGKLRLKQ